MCPFMVGHLLFSAVCVGFVLKMREVLLEGSASARMIS